MSGGELTLVSNKQGKNIALRLGKSGLPRAGSLEPIALASPVTAAVSSLSVRAALVRRKNLAGASGDRLDVTQGAVVIGEDQDFGRRLL